MKSDLIISRYKTEKIIGTKSSFDARTFFGSKMIDIEDSILVDNSEIQYSEIFDVIDKRNNGYQYYIDIDNVEKMGLAALTEYQHQIYTGQVTMPASIRRATLSQIQFRVCELKNMEKRQAA